MTCGAVSGRARKRAVAEAQVKQMENDARLKMLVKLSKLPRVWLTPAYLGTGPDTEAAKPAAQGATARWTGSCVASRPLGAGLLKCCVVCSASQGTDNRTGSTATAEHLRAVDGKQ